MSERKSQLLIRSVDMALAIEEQLIYVYFIRDLKRIRIDVRDGENGRIDLQELAAKTLNHCAEHWAGSWGQIVAPALYLLHIRQTHGQFPSGEAATTAWEQAFAFGIFIERLRKKYDLGFHILEETLTPEQMSKELEEETDE